MSVKTTEKLSWLFCCSPISFRLANRFPAVVAAGHCRHGTTQRAHKGNGDQFPPAGHTDGHAAAPGEEEPKAAFTVEAEANV